MIKRIGRGTTFKLRLRSFLCFCLFACFFTGLISKSFADTYPRQSGVDALNYVFRLTLSDAADEILGEATVDLRFLKDGIADFTLDLASVNDGKGMRVSEVQSRGAALRFSHEADLLRVKLDSPSQASERRQFIIRYRGVPARGLRILKNKFGERCFFSENWPNNARQWLPMIDHPYLTQAQSGEAYRLPLEIGLTFDGAPKIEKIEKVEMIRKQQRFEIAADKEPVAVTLDPNTRVLMEARFGKR